MPAHRDQTQGDGVPNIFWEDLDLMTIRIRRNTHPHAWSQSPPNRLSHVVSNVVIESVADNGDVTVRSKFHCSPNICATRSAISPANTATTWCAPRMKTGTAYRIRLQRVDLLNAEGPFDYVIQWWL